jgi:S-adenosylmethionine decarboxylase
MGRHYLLNLYGCSFELLDDEALIIRLLEEAAILSGATILQTISHKFEPQGVTAIVLLSESHLSIHSFPENGTAAIDLFCCGDAKPEVGCEFLIKELKPTDYKIQDIQR